ncbi:hypothetical protein PybrP1_005093 [[Pythium] brassicae (nom. inval.)]|nr:hypothetical protein PybrP1_005093 [[Pythium] brassicae (nom. inval.)]
MPHDDSSGERRQLSRRAKLQGVDYAVLSTGQQIPEYSSESSSSDDDATYGGSRKRRKKTGSPDGRHRAAKGRAKATGECFICRKHSRSPFMQCEICARWYHYRCWKPFESASVLGNTSCHEGSTATRRAAAPTSLGAPPSASAAATADGTSATTPRMRSLADFVRVLRKAKNVLVVAGAGMSVSCGIPDFRSKDGIYAMIERMDTHLPEPECLFQIEYFRQDPAPFFELVRTVFAHSPAPSTTHRFLRLLQDKRKLLRLYSQNIDGLEDAAGVTRCIPCHGSFASSRCMRCERRVPTSALLGAIRAGEIPTCADERCRGVLKPEITFFGELLADHVSTSVTKDRLRADLLLVIGTSLKVSPVAEIPGFLPSHIPQVVINKTALKKKALRSNSKKPPAASSTAFDLTLLGDCDEIVEQICALAGWDLPESSLGDGTTPAGLSNADEDDYDDDDDFEPHVVRKTTSTTKKTAAVRVIEHADKPNVLCFGECHCTNKLAGRHDNDDDEDEDGDGQASGFVCDGCDKNYGARTYSNLQYYKCDECFDFDLCRGCFQAKARAHCGGAHAFSKAWC